MGLHHVNGRVFMGIVCLQRPWIQGLCVHAPAVTPCSSAVLAEKLQSNGTNRPNRPKIRENYQETNKSQSILVGLLRTRDPGNIQGLYYVQEYHITKRSDITNNIIMYIVYFHVCAH